MQSLLNGRRQMIKQNTQHVPSYMSDTVYLNLDNSEITLSKVSSKLLYKAFKSRKQVPPTAQETFNPIQTGLFWSICDCSSNGPGNV